MRAKLMNYFRQYQERGGFPEVQMLAEEYAIQILQEYVDIVLLRDIIERHAISNVQALRVMVRHLMATPATMFSVNKFYNDLKTQGISCTKNSLYEYLEHLHDAFLVFPVSIHHVAERVRRTNPRKIYLIDTGLISAFLHRPQANRGQLLENFVFIELKRRNLKVEYYRTSEQTEVDFFTASIRGEQGLYQVALNINDPVTKEREIRALNVAMQECNLTNATLITLDQREVLDLPTGRINIVPVWAWALGIV